MIDKRSAKTFSSTVDSRKSGLWVAMLLQNIFNFYFSKINLKMELSPVIVL